MPKGVDGVFFNITNIRKKLRKAKSESGQSLIEFVMVLPVFILILMGMIDFGWYLKLNGDLVRANATGVRSAAFASDDTAIKQAVVDASNTRLNVIQDLVTVTRQDPTMTRGTWVEVSTTTTYQSVTGFSVVDLLLNNKPLQATARSRIE